MSLHMLCMLLTMHMVHTARIEDKDPGFEQDAWTVSSESEQLLRADRWYYKGMNRLRDNPDKAGLHPDIVSLHVAHMACMAHMDNSYMLSRHSN